MLCQGRKLVKSSVVKNTIDLDEVAVGGEKTNAVHDIFFGSLRAGLELERCGSLELTALKVCGLTG